YARCYINGSSEYNALGLFMGSNDAIKNILDLNIDGVPQMPVMENSYLILTDNLKNIPLEVSYILKTADGIQPYIHHYHQVNYGISINGKQMTSVDMYNIPCLKSGKAHFEDERSGYYWANKPTLVLENATLECDGSTGVNNGHYGSTFNIKVVGDCTITGKGEMFNPLYLDSETSTTIKGGGTLNLISANEGGKAGDAIYSGMEARLTLTDYTTLIATSIDNSGYCDEGEGRFTIDSGYFCAYSEKSYPLWLPSQLLLGQGVDLRYPVGGQVLGNYVYGADGAPVQGGWVMFGYDTQVMDELIDSLTSSSRLGDVNLDGAVDIADAVCVLNAMAGQTVAGDANVNGDFDANGNPVIDIADLVTVLNIMAGQ
ncbi:MAG: dockerin type I repeat-containing protein, partial [Bacteroidaceae bacterium]|nr:dockerin type I repeat-containing protein [Bacteroidaceae bacterium]